MGSLWIFLVEMVWVAELPESKLLKEGLHRGLYRGPLSGCKGDTRSLGSSSYDSWPVFSKKIPNSSVRKDAEGRTSRMLTPAVRRMSRALKGSCWMCAGLAGGLGFRGLGFRV